MTLFHVQSGILSLTPVLSQVSTNIITRIYNKLLYLSVDFYIFLIIATIESDDNALLQSGRPVKESAIAAKKLFHHKRGKTQHKHH